MINKVISYLHSNPTLILVFIFSFIFLILFLIFNKKKINKILVFAYLLILIMFSFLKYKYIIYKLYDNFINECIRQLLFPNVYLIFGLVILTIIILLKNCFSNIKQNKKIINYIFAIAILLEFFALQSNLEIDMTYKSIMLPRIIMISFISWMIILSFVCIYNHMNQKIDQKYKQFEKKEKREIEILTL